MMTQLEAEMETLLIETPRAAPPLPRNQQRRWEEQWRLGVAQQQRRRVDESILASAPDMGGEGVCLYDDVIPGYTGLHDRNALDGEQQEDFSLRARLIRSTGIWKGKGVMGAAATGTADHPQCPRLNCLPFGLPKYESLMDIQGFVSLFAKDQKGCQFLRHKFEMGTEQEREIIFNEIIEHVPELMMNRFGNELMKKVLDICTEEQRLKIVLVLTEVPNELVWISLNRAKAVQKLIEVLQSEKETALIISALEPGFLNLVMNQNGNHVVQRCLQCFNYEQKEVDTSSLWQQRRNVSC